MDPTNTTKENNFKWGVLHTYRLLVNIKDSIFYVENIVENYKDIDIKDKEIEAFFIDKGDIIAEDLYQSYKLYKHSFTKIQKISLSIDNLIKKVFKNDALKVKIDSKAESYKAFFENLYKDNKEIVSSAISKITDRVDLLDVKGSVKNIFRGLEENEEDVDARLKRIEIVVRLFLESLDGKYPEQHAELKLVFNEETAEEAKAAIKLAFEKKTADPIKDFLDSKSYAVDLLKEVWEIISYEYEESEIERVIRPEVEAIVAYVDKEAAKDLEARAEVALEDIEVIADETADELKAENEGKEEELEAMLESDYEELKNDIEPEVEKVDEALGSEDKELDEKGKEIVDEVRDFVEQD